MSHSSFIKHQPFNTMDHIEKEPTEVVLTGQEFGSLLLFVGT